MTTIVLRIISSVYHYMGAGITHTRNSAFHRPLFIKLNENVSKVTHFSSPAASRYQLATEPILRITEAKKKKKIKVKFFETYFTTLATQSSFSYPFRSIIKINSYILLAFVLSNVDGILEFILSLKRAAHE